jgi:hypothetical protein
MPEFETASPAYGLSDTGCAAASVLAPTCPAATS